MKVDTGQIMSSIMWGGARSMVLNTWLYPVEVAKNHIQANDQQSRRHIVVGLFHEKGWKGFYEGYVAKSSFHLLKQVYTWPMLVTLPPFFRRVLGDEKGFMAKFATATSLSFANGVVCTPIERYRVWKVTAIGRSNVVDFFRVVKKRSIAEAYRGFVSTFLGNQIGWAVFLLADQYFRGHDPERKRSLTEKTWIGVKVGLCVSTVLAPFDLYKTGKQKNQPTKQGGWRWFTTQLRQGKGMYRGGVLFTLHTAIQSVGTVLVLDLMEKKGKN